MRPGSLSGEQLRTLACDIRDGAESAETDWLEWKSALDLSNAKAARFEVARQILGMANRIVSLAQRSCGGYGYILIGVEKGSMPGTTWSDPAQLHDWINAYLGATGPAWQPRYIQANSATVLAIEVAPPRAGDPMHTLRKSYEGFHRGAIFVRKTGKTHPAEPEDIENLQRRLQGTHLDLRLSVIGNVPVDRFDRQVLFARIMKIAHDKKDAQLRRAHLQPSDPVTNSHYALSRTMANLLHVPDDRTITEYTDEVAEWHARWTERAPEHWARAYAAAGHGKFSIRLTNLSDHNFTSVEVCLTFCGAQVITDLNEMEAVLPEMPRSFGQGRRITGIPELQSTLTWPLLVSNPEHLQTLRADNDASGASVTWDVGDVRPEQTLNTDPMHLLIGEASSTRCLTLGWRATSKSVSGVASGVIELPLSDSPVPLDSIEHELGALDRG